MENIHHYICVDYTKNVSCLQFLIKKIKNQQINRFIDYKALLKKEKNLYIGLVLMTPCK